MPRRGRVRRCLAVPLAVAAACAAATPAGAAERFPRGFLWGTASAGFQVEAGGSPAHADRRSDWWAFTHDPGLIAASRRLRSWAYRAALSAVENQGLANAAAYDAIHAHDRRARVGFVVNMVDWRPADPLSSADALAAAHADRIFNRTFIDLAVDGWYDTDADGVQDPGELRPALRGKADFVGVNHYSPGRAQALGAPVSGALPLFDFLPQVAYGGGANPGGPPCPTTCTDFGWEIDPSGLRNVIAEAASYGKPVYVTENGIDDAADTRRADYLRGYLRALHDAVAAGADVRGYFHWSLLDNYEWAEGYRARFGLYGFDPDTLARVARPSARLYARVARTRVVP